MNAVPNILDGYGAMAELPPLEYYGDAAPRDVKPSESSSTDAPEAFDVYRVGERTVTGKSEIVQGVYGRGGLVALVGAPGSGKTAFAIHNGLHVSAGETWFNQKTMGGPVIYFASEAPASVDTRALTAMSRLFPGRSLPFHISPAVPQLGGNATAAADAEKMIATIRKVEADEGEPVAVAFIDTLASCIGDGDENSDGMMRLVAAAKYVAVTVGCAVMLVHHPSKASSGGLRGHGSLAAACDAIITVEVDEVSGIRTATLVKSRDSATGLQFAYTLDQVVLPEPDSFGDATTTIVVNPVRVAQSRPRPTGPRQQALLAELERRHRSGECGWSEAVVREAGRLIGIKPQSTRDALKGLMTAGYLWGQPAHLTLKFPPEDTK